MSEGVAGSGNGRLIPTEFPFAGGKLRLRAATDADLPLLAQIYASTRDSEMAMVPWSEAQKADFLRFQFQAQHQYYLEHFPAASRELIEVDDQPAGRLYLDQRADELRLIDIALLPDYRGRGVGGLLLQAILDAAAARGLAVSIHVEQNNPALRLYQRMGFAPVEEQGVYLLMRWQPNEPTGNP